MEINSNTSFDKKNITIIDVGSDKLKCINFNISRNGDIVILAKAEYYSDGIRGGNVLNVDSAKRAINSVTETTETLSEQIVDEIFINIADCGMKSQHYRAKIETNNRKITVADIVALQKQVTDKLDSQVIHAILLDCHIDGIQEVSNPVGMYGKTVNSSFNIVTLYKTLILNLENTIAQCNLKLKGCVVSAYSAGYLALSKDEKEFGSAVIDIGAYYTSVGIFKKGKFISAFNIPVGGAHISKDLACGLNVGFAIAEKIKKTCANFILDSKGDEKIDLSTISNGTVVSEVNFSDIADIIKPRLEEIFEMIQAKITNYRISRAVITGGGGKIFGIEKIATEILSVKTRAQDNFTINDVLYTTEYTSLIGLMKIIQDVYAQKNDERSSTGYFSKLLKAFSLK